MGLLHSHLKRLPLSSAIIYLTFGFLLGPFFLDRLHLTLQHSHLLELLSEVVVIISVFAAGLKLKVPFRDVRWRLVLRLASASMVITVAGVALLAYFIFDFSLGAAILLGAILAPTDPVLASGVQVQGPEDQDRLRFSLTGEAGFNDSTAFPFVMLGLGLMGLHDLGSFGMKWILKDLIWAIGGGVMIGWGAGWILSHIVTYYKRHNEESVVLDDFLGFGLVALAYGVAVGLSAYGFIAVFAAAISFQQLEKKIEQATGDSGDQTVGAVLTFHEQLERIGEVATVLVVGSLLSYVSLREPGLLLIPLLFLLIRPLSVYSVVQRQQAGGMSRALMAWFGIRGIGSIYYLTYAINHGRPATEAARISSIVLVAIAVSVVVHGVSVTPLMHSYERARA